ncbi:hypothetical protein IGI80_002860 [Enterococcus sp. DIV1420a]
MDILVFLLISILFIVFVSTVFYLFAYLLFRDFMTKSRKK